MDSREGAHKLTVQNSLHLDGKTGLGNTMAWLSYFPMLELIESESVTGGMEPRNHFIQAY